MDMERCSYFICWSYVICATEFMFRDSRIKDAVIQMNAETRRTYKSFQEEY
jgi:hypothetical protein